MIARFVQSKKYRYIALLLLLSGQHLSVLCMDDPSKNWSGDAWEAMKHPVVAGVALLAAKYVVNGVAYAGQELYVTYYLTEEQQKERLEKLSEQEQERRIARLTKEQDLALKNTPEWIQMTLEHKKQHVEREGHSLIDNLQKIEQNRLLLMEERVKREKEEIEHLSDMIAQTSTEKRAALQALKDARIQDFFQERARGNK